MNKPFNQNDPETWPVADALPADTFLGSFNHDCAPNLTDEQKRWPVAECESADVLLQPSLVVELTLRPDADQGEVALGMAELLRALSEREETLGGSGLVYNGRKSYRDQRRVQIVLYPKKEAGARQRLWALAELIERGGKPVLPLTVVGDSGSFMGCHATVAA